MPVEAPRSKSPTRHLILNRFPEGNLSGSGVFLGTSCTVFRGASGTSLYIYSFEIMIFVRVKAKSLLCYWAVRDLGIGMAQIARRLNLSLAGVSQSVKRGERIVQENDYKLIEPWARNRKTKGRYILK